MEKFKKITIIILSILLTIIFAWGILFLSVPVVKDWTYGIFGKKQQQDNTRIYFGYIPNEHLDTYKFFTDGKELTLKSYLGEENEIAYERFVVEVQKGQKITCQIYDSTDEYYLSRVDYYSLSNVKVPESGVVGLPDCTQSIILGWDGVFGEQYIDNTFDIAIGDYDCMLTKLIVGKKNHALTLNVNDASTSEIGVTCQVKLYTQDKEIESGVKLPTGEKVKGEITLLPTEAQKDKDLAVLVFLNATNETSSTSLATTKVDNFNYTFEFEMLSENIKIVVSAFVNVEIIIPPIISP